MHANKNHINMDISGVCHLTGDINTSCGVCGQTKWTEDESMSDIVIITQNCIFKAISKYRNHVPKFTIINISSFQHWKLMFEGQSMGLLVIKSYCILYEVLRHHMHKFLDHVGYTAPGVKKC